jgi:hypothetical protein
LFISLQGRDIGGVFSDNFGGFNRRHADQCGSGINRDLRRERCALRVFRLYARLRFRLLRFHRHCDRGRFL